MPPIHEYLCAKCGGRMEVLQKWDEGPPKACEHCGQGGKLERQLSAPSFRLKGGGWYETDFKSGNKRNLAGGDKSDKPADKSAQTSSGESAPAKSGESAPPAKSAGASSASSASSTSSSTSSNTSSNRGASASDG